MARRLRDPLGHLHGDVAVANVKGTLSAHWVAFKVGKHAQLAAQGMALCASERDIPVKTGKSALLRRPATLAVMLHHLGLQRSVKSALHKLRIEHMRRNSQVWSVSQRVAGISCDVSVAAQVPPQGHVLCLQLQKRRCR